MFDRFAQQRQQFSTELESMASAYGDDIDEDGSLLGAAHRRWMAVKDALAGSDPEGVLDAAVQGEDHAIGTFESELAEDISSGLRTLVRRQLEGIRVARAEVASHQAAA